MLVFFLFLVHVLFELLVENGTFHFAIDVGFDDFIAKVDNLFVEEGKVLLRVLIEPIVVLLFLLHHLL